MNRVSKARAKQLREYAKLKKEFLREHDECFVCGDKLLYDMRDLHHLYGRVGRLLTFVPGFRCVCCSCHHDIHSHPVEASRAGFLGPRGTWNDFDRAVKHRNEQKPLC